MNAFAPLKTLAALALAAAAIGTAQAENFTVSGNLGFNTDVVRIDFSLTSPSSVVLWTDSWQAGLNFDPTLSLFDAGSNLLVTGDDTPDPADLLPGQGGFDSQIAFASLASGSYFLSLSASGNDPVGTTFADGFSLAGTTPIPISSWNQPSYDINANDQKGSFWQVHLDGVSQVSAVPEPGETALMLAGFAAMAAVVRRRRPAAPR